jgi:hypothetical protein
MDYGDLVKVGLDRVSELPPELANIEPQAVVIDLAFLRPLGVPDGVVGEIWELVRNRRLYVFLVARHERPQLLLTDRPEVDAQ